MPPKLIDDDEIDFGPRRFEQAAADARLFTRAYGIEGDIRRTFGASAGMRSLINGIGAILHAGKEIAVGMAGTLAYRFAQHYEYFRELDAVSPLDPLQDIQSRLTYTECDILTLMARGYSDGRITEILAVRRATFDSYLRHIYLAIGLVNRGQLRVWLAENGGQLRR
jgi:DNA-binding CsgD family transcriptional regulator